jgi:hypothetical protein
VISLKFEKRDVILIAGLLLFMVGLTPFTGLALAMIIVIIMYFGIKLYVKKRKQSIENDVGEGICMECGSKILDKKCPKCDYSQE